MSKIIRSLLIVLAMTVLMTPSASAQYQPTISPWLSMFNNNRGGALSNYHTFVKPQQMAIQEFQTQERQIRSQAAQQQQLQGEVDKILTAPRKSQSIGGMHTSGYGQHLHYYQGIPGRNHTNYGYGAARRR